MKRYEKKGINSAVAGSLGVVMYISSGLIQAGTTELVSLDHTGAAFSTTQGDISANGRYVVFDTSAPITANDTNGSGDIFLRDLQTGTNELVSLANDGSQGNGQSRRMAVSPSGRYVIFTSSADNLVSGDANGLYDVFIRDRDEGTTELVSIASDGTQQNKSAVGSIALSDDGRFIAFSSAADNLVPNDTNGERDVFVRDRELGTTERVSVSSQGAEATYGIRMDKITISANGRYVGFSSGSNNLVPGDTNEAYFDADIFLHDRETGITERINVSSAGVQAGDSCTFYSMSADARYFAFTCYQDHLVIPSTPGATAYIHDRQNHTTEYVIFAADGTPRTGRQLILSADGRYITFSSSATDLVAGDTNGWVDVFVRDRENNTTKRVSVANDGTEADRTSVARAISADGRYIIFSTLADNLGGNPYGWSIYLHDRQPAGCF